MIQVEYFHGVGQFQPACNLNYHELSITPLHRYRLYHSVTQQAGNLDMELNVSTTSHPPSPRRSWVSKRRSVIAHSSGHCSHLPVATPRQHGSRSCRFIGRDILSLVFTKFKIYGSSAPVFAFEAYRLGYPFRRCLCWLSEVWN